MCPVVISAVRVWAAEKADQSTACALLHGDSAGRPGAGGPGPAGQWQCGTTQQIELGGRDKNTGQRPCTIESVQAECGRAHWTVFIIIYEKIVEEWGG